MRIRVLGSSPTDPDKKHYLTTFLINEVVAVDAGCLGLHGTPSEQSRVRDVFLTHSHADHVASLPMFIENTCEDGADCVAVHGSAATLQALRSDVFNDRIWPDFLRIAPPQNPFLRLRELQAERTVTVAGLRVTPVPVDHVVPTFGYVVEEAGTVVVFGGDSGPTERIWEVARATGRVAAVFLEASLPNDMAELADRAKHLTPELFKAEVAKLPPGTRTIAIHIKPRFREAVVAELMGYGLPGVEIGRLEEDYSF